MIFANLEEAYLRVEPSELIEHDVHLPPRLARLVKVRPKEAHRFTVAGLTRIIRFLEYFCHHCGEFTDVAVLTN